MDLEFDIKCPKCSRKVKLKVKEMVPGRSKTCPGCGTKLEFTGDDGRPAQKAFDELQKTLKNFGKKK